MTTCGQDGSPPRSAQTIGCRAVGTTSTANPREASRPEMNSCAPRIPSRHLGSAETLGCRMNSLSFSTGSNMAGSVAEMADAGEDHRQAALVRRLDHGGVAERAAGLDR